MNSLFQNWMSLRLIQNYAVLFNTASRLFHINLECEYKLGEVLLESWQKRNLGVVVDWTGKASEQYMAAVKRQILCKEWFKKILVICSVKMLYIAVQN